MKKNIFKTKRVIFWGLDTPSLTSDYDDKPLNSSETSDNETDQTSYPTQEDDAAITKSLDEQEKLISDANKFIENALKRLNQLKITDINGNKFDMHILKVAERHAKNSDKYTKVEITKIIEQVSNIFDSYKRFKLLTDGLDTSLGLPRTSFTMLSNTYDQIDYLPRIAQSGLRKSVLDIAKKMYARHPNKKKIEDATWWFRNASPDKGTDSNMTVADNKSMPDTSIVGVKTSEDATSKPTIKPIPKPSTRPKLANNLTQEDIDNLKGLSNVELISIINDTFQNNKKYPYLVKNRDIAAYQILMQEFYFHQKGKDLVLNPLGTYGPKTGRLTKVFQGFKSPGFDEIKMDGDFGKNTFDKLKQYFKAPVLVKKSEKNIIDNVNPLFDSSKDRSVHCRILKNNKSSIDERNVYLNKYAEHLATKFTNKPSLNITEISDILKISKNNNLDLNKENKQALGKILIARADNFNATSTIKQRILAIQLYKYVQKNLIKVPSINKKIIAIQKGDSSLDSTSV